MAIRISRGTQPQYGRITMPKGTYLSNPSTAASGSIAGGAGSNPAQVNMWGNVTPGYNAPFRPAYNPFQPVANAFSQVGSALNKTDQALRGTQLYSPVSPSQFGPLAPVVQFGQSVNSAAGALGRGIQQSNRYVAPVIAKSNAQTQQAYGFSGIQNAGGNSVIPVTVANQNGALDGMSPEQTNIFMQQQGYSQNYISGLGQVWVKTGPAQQAAKPTGGTGAYGDRPEYVDGASLQPGESVVDAQGNRYVGGTPTEDGTAQYALNYANPAAARDEKGKYKWVSEVRKDKNGNWVRVNRQVLRKAYTRSHLKKAAARNEVIEQQAVAQAAAEQPQTPNINEYTQLVNFRAAYG